MKKLFIILAVIALMMGCTERQQSLFRQAWELIEDRPDSARAILEKVRVNALTKSGQAEYGLLKTIVDYKTVGPIKNDSLISASIAYYDQHGDDWHRGRAYLYRGALRMFRTHDIPNAVLDTIVIDHDTLVAAKVPPEYHQDAIKDIKTAEAIAEDADDEKLKNHAYELMAYSCVPPLIIAWGKKTVLLYIRRKDWICQNMLTRGCLPTRNILRRLRYI